METAHRRASSLLKGQSADPSPCVCVRAYRAKRAARMVAEAKADEVLLGALPLEVRATPCPPYACLCMRSIIMCPSLQGRPP